MISIVKKNSNLFITAPNGAEYMLSQPTAKSMSKGENIDFLVSICEFFRGEGTDISVAEIQKLLREALK